MKKSVVAGLSFGAVALALVAKDQVIMTVNGTDVPKSEFEYLYNKNSQQQINPQSLDEYVEMFKLYKMKVADARAEGLDTMASFRKEAEQYRHDLAAPYLADSVYLNKLVDEAYKRSLNEAEAYHIMLFKARDPQVNAALSLRADSIHQVLMNGGDFNDMVVRFSQDRGSNEKGGYMGYIVAGRYPVDFEIAAFNTPEGKISNVVESPQGFHILKGGKKRPARGSVQVAHILKLTQGLDEAGKARARREIDSLYNLAVANPDNFNKLASENSEDRGSARQGGMLPFFGPGEMVPEFEQASFELKNGEISKPVETAYGYHIIKKYDSKGVASRNEMKPQTIARITSRQDPRSLDVMRNQTKKFAKKHKASLNAENIAKLRKEVAEKGLNPELLADWTTMPKASMPIASVDGKTSTLKDFASKLEGYNLPVSPITNSAFDENLDIFFNQLVVNAEEDWLLAHKPEYSNLLKEYVDGSLLYEVSVQKVWDKAAKDEDGLKKYFEKHRDNYKWTEPRAKGFLVQASSDSVASLVKARAEQLAPDTLVNTIRKEFPREVGIDRVLVVKGTNPMVDNIVFGGPAVVPSSKNLPIYFMINPRVIVAPEEANDVKGLVTTDYQNEFQANWEKELKSKYPVTVNEKVLRSVKPLKKK